MTKITTHALHPVKRGRYGQRMTLCGQPAGAMAATVENPGQATCPACQAEAAGHQVSMDLDLATILAAPANAAQVSGYLDSLENYQLELLELALKCEKTRQEKDVPAMSFALDITLDHARMQELVARLSDLVELRVFASLFAGWLAFFKAVLVLPDGASLQSTGQDGRQAEALASGASLKVCLAMLAIDQPGGQADLRGKMRKLKAAQYMQLPKLIPGTGLFG
jgi:hypothetical protein